ncbi:MAG: type II toxin-antitoxin system mRNA interferase toxin, RelE/StbE family [Patescibacteria group bacterium]
MKILLHRRFKKAYDKLQSGEQRKFTERRDLFLQNPFHPLLNNHPLRGKYTGYRSIDVTGDLRIHYQPIDKNTTFFITIGTHHELYGT